MTELIISDDDGPVRAGADEPSRRNDKTRSLCRCLTPWLRQSRAPNNPALRCLLIAAPTAFCATRPRRFRADGHRNGRARGADPALLHTLARCGGYCRSSPCRATRGRIGTTMLDAFRSSVSHGDRFDTSSPRPGVRKRPPPAPQLMGQARAFLAAGDGSPALGAERWPPQV